jgi:L-amino acid N-acyltransferase YncA
MRSAGAMTSPGTRELGAADINRVVTIDRAHTGQGRRRFFEKRFAAAKARPGDFVHVGVMRGGSLRGFILAHVRRGEFGLDDAVGVVDGVGVEPECQERGVGQALMEGMVTAMRQKSVRRLHSQASWTNHNLIRFFNASGFSLSSRLVLERSVSEPLAENLEDV